MGQVPSFAAVDHQDSSVPSSTIQCSAPSDWVDLKDEAETLLENNNGGMRTNGKNEVDGEMMTKEEAKKLRIMKQKYDELKSLMASMQIRPKRSHIRMTIEDCGNLFGQREFKIFSEPIEVVGFQWKLGVSKRDTEERKGWIGLYLHAYPPQNYNGQYCIEVENTCTRFCQVVKNGGKDIEKEAAYRKYNRCAYTGWGFAEVAKIEDLLSIGNGFLTPIGTINVEAEFTIKSATLEQILNEF